MRTQPSGSAETLEVFELLDVIDADPGAFGPSTSSSVRAAHPPRRPPSWPYLAVAATIAIAAVVVLLRPWETSAAWRTFPVTQDAPTQPGLWVLAEPPAPLMSVLAATADTATASAVAPLGQLFAADGATYERGRWAMFEVDQVAPEAEDAEVVAVDPRAAPIETAGGQRRTLTWQLDGTRLITVTAQGFTDDDLRTFAAAVGLHDGHAALRTGYSLRSLQPRSSISGFVAAQQMLDSFGQAPPPPSVSIVRYRAVSTPTAVATNPAPSDAAEAVRFLLGGADIIVDDLPAVSSRSSTLGTVIAWVADGRLLVTTGSLSPTVIAQRAAAVRPLVDADQPTTVDAADAVSVGRGRTSDGRTWEATAHFGRVTAICVIVDESGSNCAFDAHATLPQLNYITTDLGIVVVILSNRVDSGAVRLATLEGATTVRVLRPLVWDISAVAVLPAPGESYTLVGSEQATDADRLQPVAPADDRYLLDDPLLSPYSADLPTPLPSPANFNLWTVPGMDRWFWVQAARGGEPRTVTFDAQRRVVNGVDVVSPLDDPQSTSVSVELDDGWWVTIRGRGFTDVAMTTLAGNVRVVDGEVTFIGRDATFDGLRGATADWSEHLLFGRVHSESRYLTTTNELVTLRVGDGLATNDRAALAPYLLDDVSVGDGVVSGTWPDTDEQVVIWTEGDQVLTLAGRVPLTDLLALRPAVRPAIGDEWIALLRALRPDYRLGEFTQIGSGTSADGEPWTAGVQLAERRGEPQYLWWWTVPGDAEMSASVDVRDQLDGESPTVDILVVGGATYVFVTVPSSTPTAVVFVEGGGVAVPLSFRQPFPDSPFSAGVTRFDASGPATVTFATGEPPTSTVP